MALTPQEISRQQQVIQSAMQDLGIGIENIIYAQHLRNRGEANDNVEAIENAIVAADAALPPVQ